MGRRLALLGGSAAAAAAALAVQLVRLRLEPSGAAVHGVALLVTLIVFVILLRLVRLQLSGPGLEAPSWERHAHRASLREAPMVALAGMGVAAFLVVATPRLVVDERPAAPAAFAVHVSEPDRSAPAVTPDKSKDLVAVALGYKYDPSARTAGGASLTDSEPYPLRGPLEVNYRWAVQGQEENSRDPRQEPVDPTRPERDTILRVRPNEPGLPPVQFGVGVLLATAKGTVDLTGSTGNFQLDLDTVRGEQTFESGVDLTAEFALTPESALKVIYAGMAFFEKGRLGGDAAFGGATASEGDSYEFEMRWSHLYIALAKRLTGPKGQSPFEFSIHAGAMVDHTLSELEVEDAGVSAESEDGEKGWVALGAGFTAALRGAGPVGAVIELVQSAPLNIGGQAIALTDVRAGMTLELTQEISMFAGYRYVRAAYRVFEAPLVRTGGETAADLAVRGPVFGVDFRF